MSQETIVNASKIAKGKGIMKIYITTDIEGVSGVYSFNHTWGSGTPEHASMEARKYLMNDLGACIEGLKEGGADYILAINGHGPGNAFIPELMPEGARYIINKPYPRALYGLDETFDGLVMIGWHAMMGTEDGVLHHTQNSRMEKRYWYNGVETGEIGQNAMQAAHFNVPVIMVTGDEAACREARKFLGDEVTTVAVKKGISRECAMLYPFGETRRKIRQGAIEAMKNIKRCKPYKATFPMKAKYTDKTGKIVEREINSVAQIKNFSGEHDISAREEELWKRK